MTKLQIGFLACVYPFFSRTGQDIFVIPKLDSIEQVSQLFPQTTIEIQEKTEKTRERALKKLDLLYAVPADQRTFDNTIRALDLLTAEFMVFSTVCAVLELVHPDSVVRQAAHQASVTLHNFSVDYFAQNSKLYAAVMSYVENCDLGQLNSEERYSLQELCKEFKKSGLHLAPDIQEQLKTLKKSVGIHELQFEKNIATDNRTIQVSRQELAGLSDEFINNLSKVLTGSYEVGVDYPTYTYVMENCTVESTRKKLWQAFFNRAYPANQHELSQIIMLRDQIAQLSGFASYAQFDLSNQMAKSPEVVECFLDDLLARCQLKADQDVAQYMQDLPVGVAISAGNKFKPWNLLFVRNYFKKKRYEVDEVAVSEYFPLDYTLNALFDIYQSFFGITFKPAAQCNLWHPDIDVRAVYKDKKFLGYVLLDIFPRENKFTHACEITIVPTFENKDSGYHPALVLVIANFPRSVGAKPALLPRPDVIVFFHEFGHAIHALLGTTELASNSGANVKRDFVEMPSQMLEEWMWQPDVLKKISCHYQTKKPLPDELIEKILALKNYNTGEHLQRQIYLSYLSLNYYKQGAIKDLYTVSKNLFEKIIKHVEFQPEDHFYASFGHLTGYGAKYYSYLWSKVFALDLFEKIKRAYFSKDIADRYINSVISKGGSADPYDLLRDFLKREPNADAFFKDMGL